MITTALEPTDAATAAQMLADATRDRRRVAPTGNGTKLRNLALDSDVVPLSSLRLNGGPTHYAGDLVAIVPAGATLREVNGVLAANRQWLPLDPRLAARATIGGIVATNDSGPRRHRYGAPRDLIIGIEVALASGRVVHAGGRVVKNVAGYDLSRLFCGSRGSLGMITSVTFKLAPLPPASRTVVARFRTAADAAAAALTVANSSLVPSTIELVSPEPRLFVRFESTPRAAQHMAETAASLLAATSTDMTTVADAEETQLWGEVEDSTASSSLLLDVAVLPTAAASLLAAIERAASGCGVVATVAGRAGLGVYLVGAGGLAGVEGSADTGDAAEKLLSFASSVRAAAHALNGHVQVARTADALARAARSLNDLPASAAAVGRAVKQRFDPAGILPAPWSGDLRG